MIIGITGLKRSGKNTAASYLSEKYGYKEFSFAAPLKYVTDTWLGAVSHSEDDREEIQEFYVTTTGVVNAAKYLGFTKDETATFITRFYNVMDEFAIEYGEGTDSKYRMSYRKLLQVFGTDICRFTRDSIWIDFMDKSLIDVKNAVITDVRFDNEAEYVNFQFGQVIRIEREGQTSNDNHASEAGVKDTLISVVIPNTTISELHRGLDKFMEIFGDTE